LAKYLSWQPKIFEMKQSYLLLFTIFTSLISFSQEEDESCLPPAKKILKYIETAKSSTVMQDVAVNFGKAIEEAPENAMAYFEFGVYYYHLGEKQYANSSNPDVGDKSFAKAEALLKQAAEHCSNYHSDMYYFLGIIKYTQEDMDGAKTYFQKFIDFQSDDNSRYSPEFAKQTSDVKKLFASFKDEEELKTVEVPFNPYPVRNVSSAMDEYFPMISPDNLFMFYTRRVTGNEMDGYSAAGTTREVYMYSERKSETEDFDKGKAFAAPFNKGDFDSYGAASMSVDNKEMIICACKKTKVFDQPYMDCDLYSTTFEKIGPNPNDYKWSPLENLGPKINTPDGWEGQPSLSADGNTMFFTANRATTQDNDIFVVKREADGSWGTPESFDVINTAGKDKSPFLHQDSETLYFVSSTTKERKGAGGVDIFYMREENGVWGEPKNIGFPINTPSDELGLFVSTDGKLAYFSSYQGGNYNIYGFELYEEARPKPVTILKGELKDPQGAAIENASIEIAYANSDVVETVKVNGNDGKYAVVVKQEVPQDIIVSVKKEGSAYDAKLITKEEIQSKTADNNLIVKELKVGEAYTINDILYDYNSDMLSEKSKFVLREFARYLKTHEGIKLVIQGHTDSDGDDAKNMDLSDRRAKGVQRYLVSLGIEEDRLSAKGLGETQPKVANDTAENKAINRRTEFLIEGL
jgi:outer membrane protein OmpA-like peptidoglycan-associated protein/tetratricopeptide (TPR) repeat protein